MTRARLRRLFWIAAAAILVVAALVALVAVVRGRFSDTDRRIILTLVALLYAGAAGLAGLALVDRRVAHALGWMSAVAAPVGLAFMAWGVWSFVWEGEGGSEDASKLAWSWVLALAAGMVATTSLLLARRPFIARLAMLAGATAGMATALSIVGIWTDPSGTPSSGRSPRSGSSPHSHTSSFPCCSGSQQPECRRRRSGCSRH